MPDGIRGTGTWVDGPMGLKGNASWDKGHRHMEVLGRGVGTILIQDKKIKTKNPRWVLFLSHDFKRRGGEERRGFRSKEGQTQSISQSIFVTSFPDHVTSHDLWNVYNDHGVVVDAFIPYKKSKVEHKPSAPSHPSNANERSSPGSYVSILKSGKTNNVMSHQFLPSLILDDSCILDRDFILSLMGGLWVLIETVSISAKEKLLNHTSVASWFSSMKPACSMYWVYAMQMEALDLFICNDSYESKSFDDEKDAEDGRLQSRDKLTADNDIKSVSKSSCMHNNDLLYDNNHNNIMLAKDKVLSGDLFNLYDILNK
nr:RNA-directed DNA polymerase, eukaryota, nucleotide-binding alpha-beta plait domain protein [Tanacetum cinerariifolium]